MTNESIQSGRWQECLVIAGTSFAFANSAARSVAAFLLTSDRRGYALLPVELIESLSVAWWVD